MNILVKILLFLHVAAGITTLLSGPVAIYFNLHNIRGHRIAGKVFYFAMLVVAITSILTFVRHPNVLFYQFLFGLAFVVLAQLMRGVRAIFFMKGDQVRPIDRAITYTFLTAGSAMVLYGGYLLATGTGVMALGILFTVFGIGGTSDGLKYRKLIGAVAEMPRNLWLKYHIDAMIGSFIASTTAFTVNVAHGLPWFVQWFGPTVLLVPVTIYFNRKLKFKANSSVA